MATNETNRTIRVFGTFLQNEVKMTLIGAVMENLTLMTEFVNENTGEVLSSPAHDLDDDTSMKICRQYEVATGINCDFRNV